MLRNRAAFVGRFLSLCFGALVLYRFSSVNRVFRRIVLKDKTIKPNEFTRMSTSVYLGEFSARGGHELTRIPLPALSCRAHPDEDVAYLSIFVYPVNLQPENFARTIGS